MRDATDINLLPKTLRTSCPNSRQKIMFVSHPKLLQSLHNFACPRQLRIHYIWLSHVGHCHMNIRTHECLFTYIVTERRSDPRKQQRCRGVESSDSDNCTGIGFVFSRHRRWPFSIDEVWSFHIFISYLHKLQEQISGLLLEGVYELAPIAPAPCGDIYAVRRKIFDYFICFSFSSWENYLFMFFHSKLYSFRYLVEER